MSEVSPTRDCHGEVPTGEREHAEHAKHERRSANGAGQGSDSQARLSRRTCDWEVGDQRIEFAIGPGCVQRLKTLLKLVPGEASF